MAVYTITDLEKLSGIKAHTIRAWETRYHILTPHRTDSNIRYYDEADLNKLLNIVLLNKNGVKISRIAKMSGEEFAERIARISEIPPDETTQHDTLTLSMLELNEYKLDKILRTNIRQHGFEQTMIELILPFLNKLSIMWMANSITPAQEHFILNIIRQKLIAAIDDLPVPYGKGIAKFILFLPEGENQELLLLFIHFLLKKRGFHPIYLGQDISVQELAAVQKVHHAGYIYTILSESFTLEPPQKYIERLASAFPDTTILLTGYQLMVNEINFPVNARALADLSASIEFMEEVKSVQQSAGKVD